MGNGDTKAGAQAGRHQRQGDGGGDDPPVARTRSGATTGSGRNGGRGGKARVGRPGGGAPGPGGMAPGVHRELRVGARRRGRWWRGRRTGGARRGGGSRRGCEGRGGRGGDTRRGRGAPEDRCPDGRVNGQLAGRLNRSTSGEQWVLWRLSRSRTHGVGSSRSTARTALTAQVLDREYAEQP